MVKLGLMVPLEHEGDDVHYLVPTVCPEESIVDNILPQHARRLSFFITFAEHHTMIRMRRRWSLSPPTQPPTHSVVLSSSSFL